MFDQFDILAKASLMARHAAERQKLIAGNVANANTPGFKAEDLKPFNEVLASIDAANTDQFEPERVYRPGGSDPNGNTVSIENEMMASAEASSQHDTALLIYRKSMDLLRMSLRGRP